MRPSDEIDEWGWYACLGWTYDAWNTGNRPHLEPS